MLFLTLILTAVLAPPFFFTVIVLAVLFKTGSLEELKHVNESIRAWRQPKFKRVTTINVFVQPSDSLPPPGDWSHLLENEHA